jgi:hypothetical protein
MSAQSAAKAARRFSSEERAFLRHQVEEASEPIAQFWPMGSFVHHNPIHGLEHLPFDAAVREAKRLLDAEGYLPNSEYRQMYQQGRITEEGVQRAFQRVRPDLNSEAAIEIGARRIGSLDVARLHLIFGINPLDEKLAAWTFGAAGATKRFQDEVASECRLRILAKTDAGQMAGVSPEESYVTKLWTSALSALGVSDSPEGEGSTDGPEETGAAASSKLLGGGAEVELPAKRTVSDWLESLTESTIVESINEQMIKWTAAFVDEGMAGWSMPSRRQGFYHCWRELARKDLSGRFLGIKDFKRKLRELPDSPEEALSVSLNRLQIPPPRTTEYLSRHLAHLPGWAGFIRWLGENPEYPAQQRHPIDPVQYLAVRLFYEVELSDKLCRRSWGIPATLPALESYWLHRVDEYRALLGRDTPPADGRMNIECHGAWRLFRLAQFLELTPREVESLQPSSIGTLLGWLDEFPEDQHGPVWLEAYEDDYRDRVLTQLIHHRQRAAEPKAEARPRAQLVFCIDVRSEPFRRHVEEQGPYETYGFAGFFGIPISHLAFDTAERVPLCPVLLTPKHAVSETPRPNQREPLEAYVSGTRWQRLGHHLFHDLKQNPFGSLMLIDALGFFFSAGLAGKTLVQQPYESAKGAIQRWFARPVVTHIPVRNTPSDSNRTAGEHADSAPASASLIPGFTTQEQATFVENGLRTMGLTRNLGRFVVLCGHGSVSDNNPYFGALHCGACGGRHGDPSARVFAAMANDPEVRQLLNDRGFAIPEDTWFLAAKHVTTTDRVLFYDLTDLPESHAEDLKQLRADLEAAGAHQARQRCGYLPRSPKGLSPEQAYRHVVTRSMDWANVRPEWGLSGNAGFLVGRRRLTEGLDLGGRVFLHSYDPDADTEGQILEKIMTAPLIVGEWISMEHYFSAVDPWSHGSGSKVIHNVVGGVGVMLGSQSDLQTGLPLQTVNDGAKHFHEPMRLLTIIEAPASRITPIIQKHTLLQHLFHNQWVNLVALEPGTFEFKRYNPDTTWETWTPPRHP